MVGEILHESEYRFCEILWECEPVGSSELCKRCEERLGWKKSTVYTVIKRLCEKGVISSENAVVTSLVGRDEARLGICLHDIERLYGDVEKFLLAYLESGEVSEKDKARVISAVSDGKNKRSLPSFLL